MKKALLILFLTATCSAKGVLVESAFESCYSPKLLDKYKIVIREFDISVNYFFLERFLAGGTFGFFSGGTDRNDKSITALFYQEDGPHLWVNAFYAIKVPDINGLFCFGAKLGNYYSKYSLVRKTGENSYESLHGYSVEVIYRAAIGMKIMAGFKHFRPVFNTFLNFGKRKETFERMYSTYKEEKEKKIRSFQFDIGLVWLIGREW